MSGYVTQITSKYGTTFTLRLVRQGEAQANMVRCMNGPSIRNP
jgi:hypothetical protein